MTCAEVNPLGGSWVVISRVIRRATRLITHITGLIALLTTHEPPSTTNPKSKERVTRTG